MREHKKRLMRLMLVLAGVGLMVGCSASSDEGQEKMGLAATPRQANSGGDQQEVWLDEPVRLTVYTRYCSEDGQVPYDYARDALKEAFPNVELELIPQVADDGTTLETFYAGGELPDIFVGGHSMIETLAEIGELQPLEAAAEAGGYLDRMSEEIASQLYSDDGHIYCLPVAGKEYVLWFYNREIFDRYGLEVPRTFEELKTCIGVFRSAGVIPMAMFGNEGWITTAMYDVMVTRYLPGGIAWLDGKERRVTEAAYVQAAQELEKLTEAGLFQENVSGTDYEEASRMFLEGEAAMFLNGQWYIQEVADAMADNVDWMYYPAAEVGDYETRKHDFSGGLSLSGFAVNPKGQHAQLAAQVAVFMAEKYCEAKVLYRGTPMVILDTGLEPEAPYPPMMEKLVEEVPHVSSTSSFSWGLRDDVLLESLKRETRKLLDGQRSAEEFIQNIDEATSNS